MFKLILIVIVFIIAVLVITFFSLLTDDVPEDYKYPYPGDYESDKEIGRLNDGQDK